MVNIVCPCDVGDEIFVIIHHNYNNKYIIEKQIVTEISRKKIRHNTETISNGIISNGSRRDISNFGKTIFFNKEDAENEIKRIYNQKTKI